MKKYLVIILPLFFFACGNGADTPRCDNKYIQKSLIKNVEKKISSTIKSKGSTAKISKVNSTGVSNGVNSCQADVAVTIKGITYTSGAVATIDEIEEIKEG